MRMPCLLLALILGVSARTQADALPEAATPTAVAAVAATGTPTVAAPLSLAEKVAGAQQRIDGELALLDGGPLSAALEDAARSGRALRLLLDPDQLSTRLQGVAIQGITPTAQIRWKARAGKKQRRLILDGQALLAWAPGQDPIAQADGDALQQAGERFERQWRLANAELPEGQRLDDALQALPDPRENVPHFIRRRDAAGE